MKKILLAASCLLLAGSSMAQTQTQSQGQCISEHFKQARQNPTIPYEKDREIVSIWCTCKTDQLKNGASYDKTLEYCTASTSSEINAYLKKTGKL